MSLRFLPVFALAACFPLVTGSASEQEPSLEWRFGKASVCITPDEPLWMAGYGARNRPAEGKLSELWAKVLVLEDTEERRLLLITLDLVGMESGWAEELAQRLGEQFSLARSAIAINASHTHSGPVVGKNLRPLHYSLLSPDAQQGIDRYSESLLEKLTAAVHRAIAAMESGTISYGVGEATFAVNRRNNRPESEVASLRRRGALVGPVNHQVPVLVVRDAADKIAVIVFGYACHATVLNGYQWSGDYPGYAQQELESHFPDSQAMFWAGCGADQNPLPRRTVELAEHYGRRLADAVEATILTTELHRLESQASSSQRIIPLEYDRLPSLDEWREKARSNNRYEAARAQMFVEQLEAGDDLSPTYPYPIQLWQLGNRVDWFFLGGEVVVEYSMFVDALSTAPATWVAGYSNDVMAYIPSRAVWLEGGYEGADAMVYYGLPSRWAENVEQSILSACRELLEPKANLESPDD